MKFSYRKYPSGPSEAFPDRKHRHLPHISIKIKNGDKECWVRALVDSGAENCNFPADICLSLGIDLKTGKHDQIIGVGNRPFDVYFHWVDMEVGGYPMKVYAGFTEHIPIALLGQEGFFDKFDVRFNYRKKQFIITPNEEK